MGAGNAFGRDVQGGMRGWRGKVAAQAFARAKGAWSKIDLAGGAGCGSFACMSKLSFIRPRLRSATLSCAAIALLAPAGMLGAESPAPTYPPTPSQIVAEAPASEWVRIAPSDLVVMQLAPDAKGRERRVVIQLIPAPFSEGWVGNIRKLVAARWYDGVSVNRVQDNYVVQWGDANGEDTAKAKALPAGLAVVPESEYVTFFGPNSGTSNRALAIALQRIDKAQDMCAKAFTDDESIVMCEENARRMVVMDDGYAGAHLFDHGWPIALGDGDYFVDMPPEGGVVQTRQSADTLWPIHCYGMVGVGRNLSPDTGTGAELYVVIGHAPRHLDRNIALVGRVIEGIEHLSSLPRGTGPLGFYESAEERVPILSVRMGDETPGLPVYEYLDTNKDSFAAYANARANRQDEFFIRPAGGTDICNIPVPVRRKPL